MSGICLPIDAVSGSPSFPASQHRVAQAALLSGRTDRPLGARSGVRPGSEPTVTVTATTWTVTPFNGVVDPGTALTVGAFLFAFLANETGGINAADQTNPRVDRLDVQVPDDPAGASPLAAVIVYTAGTPAATPSAPAAPARSTPLGTISVPKAGTGSPSFTASYRHAVAAGGIIPARNSGEYPSSPFVGQYVDDAVAGLVRWNGSAWVTSAPPVGLLFPAPLTISGGNGTLALTHGLSFTPRVIQATVGYTGSTSLRAQLSSITSTQLIFKVYRADGTAQADGALAAMSLHVSCFR